MTHCELGLVTDSIPIKDSSLRPWQRLEAHIRNLNASVGETYKVLFVTRHGQGFHNIMEAKVGTLAWETKWALLDGDCTSTWADANLTDEGVQQAVDTRTMWSRLIIEGKMPWPQLYTSPLQRCLRTTRLVFADIASKEGQSFRPVVKELLRERTGRHTCDRRNTKSWIEINYPDYQIESGFSEKDELFDPNSRETEDHVMKRMRILLEDIFTNEPSSFVSFTMHSLASRALMQVIGHEPFRMAPGATVAFLVKAQLPSTYSTTSV
ncbi:phosphoglycerate mutase family protein [Pseudomassariella vexata]|uniref:Phosphoglycerate mutase family protein n=1 Tax=Pseudomassariella vexata TaxID=1141098 RepID=A0A1Y2DYX8_9PEZI|nr:phosphoglycerate mutase family protein [Pseudomassariella vexata]ORY64294.1 phosphoglycerate mutase family protein [Pseudomassariella vexata]